MKMSKKYEWVKEGLEGVPLLTKTSAMKSFLMPSKDYLPKGKFEGDVDLLVKCALCPNMCRFDCPISEAALNRSLTPAGKSGIVLWLLSERLAGRDAVDVAFQCCGCDSCKLWCPFGFSLGDVLQGIHVDLVKREMIPKQVQSVRDELVNNHRLDEKSVEIEAPVKGDVLFFLGCTTSAFHGGVVDSMKKIFESVGESFAVLPDEWCCGAPLKAFGFMDDFKEFAKKNAEMIRDSGAKKVVCSCPNCTVMLREVYAELGLELGFDMEKIEVLHSSQYVLEKIREGKLSDGSFEDTMVYHDPCKLSRKLEIVKAPREVLESVDLLHVKDPYFSGSESHCCGRGSGLGRIYPDLAQKITCARLEELQREAEKIVTACPTCKKAFLDEDVECLDICEVVAASLDKS